MDQSLFCTVVLLQSLERQRTVQLNMFDVLQKLLMFNIFEKNIAYKQACKSTTRTTNQRIYFQYSQRCSGSSTELIRFHCPLGFDVCIALQVIFDNRSLSMLNKFVISQPSILCFTNKKIKIAKFWWHKFHESFIRYQILQNYNIYVTIMSKQKD